MAFTTFSGDATQGGGTGDTGDTGSDAPNSNIGLVKEFANWYNNWKSTLDDRGKLDAQRAGINPLTFKAAFDAQKNMLLEGIGNKIKSYQIQKNADERTMRTVLGKNTQIQGYLNANFIDPDLNLYLTPKKNWAFRNFLKIR